MRAILVTGGAGYIGSHTTLALLQSGVAVVVLDNLCNSSAESLHRVARLAGREPVFVEGDVRDRVVLDRVFAEHSIDAVLHSALRGPEDGGRERFSAAALLRQQCARQLVFTCKTKR